MLEVCECGLYFVRLYCIDCATSQMMENECLSSVLFKRERENARERKNTKENNNIYIHSSIASVNLDE